MDPGSGDRQITLRYSIQALSNIAVFILLRYNVLSTSVYPVINYHYTLLVTSYTIFSSYLMNSAILAILNTSIVIYMTYLTIGAEFLSMNNIVYVIVVASLATLLFNHIVGSHHDVFLEALNSYRSVAMRKPSLVLVLRSWALFFATTAIVLPLTAYIYVLIATSLNSYPLSDIPVLTRYLPITVIVSMIVLLLQHGRINEIKLGFLSTLSLLAVIPIIGHVIANIASDALGRGFRLFAPSDHGKGILFGKLCASLVYGVPRKLYGRIEQEWLKRGRRKTWFWMKVRGELLIDPSKLPNKHIIIMGSSGSGKSLLAKHLLLEFYKKYNHMFIVFDPHNEYYVLGKYIDRLQVVDASKLSLNPLELGRLTPKERAHQLSSIIMMLFKLGHLQRQAIEELIIKAYEYRGIFLENPSTWRNKPPSMLDVLDICRRSMEENELYRRVYPYLRVLADSVFSQTTIELRKLLSTPTIIALNNLKSDYVRVLYVDTFLQRLMDMMYKQEISGDRMIVLDEAYTLFARDYSRHIASRLIAESRKYGIGLVFITQHPLSIPPPIVENASIKISFNISEPRNLDYVAKMFSGTYYANRVNAIKVALKSLKSLNYILTITGLSDLYIVSEEEIAEVLS